MKELTDAQIDVLWEHYGGIGMGLQARQFARAVLNAAGVDVPRATQPVARLQAKDTEEGRRLGLFDIVILDRTRCHDDMLLYTAVGVAPSPAPSMFAWRHGTPHGPAKLPGPTQTPYTEAIGQAGDAYHRQFQHAHPLPALWRWSELWERMCAAAGVSEPRHETFQQGDADASNTPRD